MVVVGGARLLQHLSMEMNPRLLGPFTTVPLRLKADSPTCPLAPGLIMDRSSLRAKIVKQLNWHKSGSKVGFSSLAGSGPIVGPKWASGPIL